MRLNTHWEINMGRNNRKKPDHWSQRAKDEGYAARSVFKLMEIDKRSQLFRKTKRILDLGCAPGSWSEFARKKRPNATIVGIDIQPMEKYPGKFIHQSIYDTPISQFQDALGGLADLVISDMAPNTSGVRFADHVRQVELAHVALGVATHTVRKGGGFVVKVFDGEDAHAFTLAVRKVFGRVRRIKPEATRNESVEFYLVATEKRENPPKEEVSTDSD